MTEPELTSKALVAGHGPAPSSPPPPKRVRSAYVCFWAKPEAKIKLDELAAARGVTRSEMARIIFGAGIAALGNR